jgi:hypothetical protein
MWLVIPDARSMLNDLYKMLTLYECPEGKKEKRMKRFEAIKKIVEGYTQGLYFPPPPPPPPRRVQTFEQPPPPPPRNIVSVDQLDMNQCAIVA